MEKEINVNYKEISLLDLKKGKKVNVLKVVTDDKTKLRKLMAFGIIEGVGLELIQRFPVYIIKVGFTQVALDKEVASLIYVKE